VPEATLYVRQACAGLAEAHAAGLVHRDLKPSNLFLTRRPDGAPSVKVLDFGIAKAMVADPVNKASAVTAQGMMLGTAHYMSPEQMDAAPDLDGRTDLWSLGVTLYELLSGQVPFDADGMMKLFALITEGEPRPLTELAPAVPAELWAVVRRCLAKDPADRFPTALALAEALSPFAAAEGPRSVPARDLAGVQARRAATTEAAPAVSTRERTALDMEMDTAARPPEGERVEPALAAATPPSAPALAPLAPRAPPRWLLAAGAALAVGVGAAAATIALRPGAAPAPPITAAPAHAAAPAATPAEPVPAPPPSPVSDGPARAEPAHAPPASSASASASPPAPRPRSPAPPPRPTASAASPPRPAAPSRTEVNIP
jgi:serine/threonine-protein kinase